MNMLEELRIKLMELLIHPIEDKLYSKDFHFEIAQATDLIDITLHMQLDQLTDHKLNNQLERDLI